MARKPKLEEVKSPTQEVTQEKTSVQTLVQLSKDFWVTTGECPTHVMVTNSQYADIVENYKNMLSDADKERLQKEGLHAIAINKNTTLDLLIVSSEVGNSRKLKFPFITAFSTFGG